jgi:uncharacterized membrane protein YcaP (DUF421 family)
MPHSVIFDHMFQLPLPILEKLLRPAIVYLALVVLLRIFGKRELAQLNPFDLVVLLSLSNTVQNAIMFEGRATVLIRSGQVDLKALQRESLTREELVDVIHRQGFDSVEKVHRCELEPNGTFYVEGFEPSPADKQHEELMARLDALQRQVAALHPQTAGE